MHTDAQRYSISNGNYQQRDFRNTLFVGERGKIRL
jgi:hypothetical protein